MTIEYKLVRYNNKSRKGTYIRISSIIKGKRKTGVYKYGFKTLEIDALKNYYTDKFIKQKKTPSAIRYKKQYYKRINEQKPKKRDRITRQAEQYIAKIKKQPKIFASIKTGVTHATINNISNATNTILNQAKEKTLRPLIGDNDTMRS